MKTTLDSAELSSKRLVARIAVSGLFGHYDYDLACPITKQIRNSQFTILYGDNGSGKTTILKLLYAILSPNRGKGYRTFIARTLFRRFSVHFSDGLSVSATRSKDEIQGAYTLSIHKDTTLLTSVHFAIDETLRINVSRHSGKQSVDLNNFLEQLAAFTLPITFLPEHRKVLSNPFASYDETAESYFLRMRAVERHDVYSATGRAIDDTLAIALDRAAKWIDRQVMGASTLSDQNAAQIYADVIKAIAKSTLAETGSTMDMTKLMATLDEVAIRSREYARFGLAPPIPSEEISKAISESLAKSRAIISAVLQPYLDGVVARLDALRTTYDLVSTFVGNINSLYHDIALEFRLGGGFRIVSKITGQPLPPQVLSSGEQQILLLMCNTLVARDSPCLVLIDEPELSLNIKWERALVQNLLDCTAGSDVQFIVATHSFELLAQYRANVVKLVKVGTELE